MSVGTIGEMGKSVDERRYVLPTADSGREGSSSSRLS